MNMPLKDYIQELFNEANLNELITDNYKRNLSEISSNLANITVIIVIIFILLYIIIKNVDEIVEDKAIKNKRDAVLHTKIQSSALFLNYGFYRDGFYNQLNYMYNKNNELDIKCVNNNIVSNNITDTKDSLNSNDNFSIDSLDIENLKDSLQK